MDVNILYLIAWIVALFGWPLAAGAIHGSKHGVIHGGFLAAGAEIVNVIMLLAIVAGMGHWHKGVYVWLAISWCLFIAILWRSMKTKQVKE